MAATAAGSTLESEMLYDAWGNPVERQGQSANKFAYTGHQADPETGLTTSRRATTTRSWAASSAKTQPMVRMASRPAITATSTPMAIRWCTWIRMTPSPVVRGL